MKILFAGTPDIAAATLKTLAVDHRFANVEIVGVLTREDAPVGRKRLLTPSPVAVMAQSLGLKTIKANRLDAPALDAIASTGAELGIVVAYGVLLKSSALSALDRGWFNLHFSVLPRWRGAAPVQRAIMAGDQTSGVTLFKLDEGMDTGPVLSVAETEIQPGETAGDLLTRCRLLGESLLAESLPAISSGIETLTAQDSSLATSAPKLHRKDVRVTASQTVAIADRMLRGAFPEPIAFAETGSQQLRLLRARPMPTGAATQAPAGTIDTVAGRILLTLADGALELLEVQPAGKNPMAAADWARGAKLPIRIESD